MRRIIPYLLVGILLLGFYYWRYRVPPGIEPIDIKVQTAQGLQSLIELHDGPLLINFYASWCGPCRREMPDLIAANDQGLFSVIGVTDDDLNRIQWIRDEYQIDFPLYQLENDLRDYGVYTIPTTYLIDQNGHVVASMTDPQEWNSEEFLNKVKLWLST